MPKPNVLDRPEYPDELLNELYTRYFLTITRRFVPEAEAAEEIIQEAALKALKALKKGQDFKDGCQKGWLVTVVRSCALDYLRKRRRMPPYLDWQDQALEAPAEADIESDLDARRKLLCLQRAIYNLPANLQSIALMISEGKTVEQIATAIGVRPPTARVRMRRTEGLLRRYVELGF